VSWRVGDHWREAYQRAASGDLSAPRDADPELELHPAARARDQTGILQTMRDPTGHLGLLTLDDSGD